MLPRAVTRVGLLATFDSPSANPLDSSLVSQMQGGQPARKSSFYAVIDYVRHRLNFSAAATWVRGLLPCNEPCWRRNGPVHMGVSRILCLGGLMGGVFLFGGADGN